MQHGLRWMAAGLAGLLGAATLTACGSSGSHAAGGGSSITVVASTDVWGDVTKQIVGDLAASKVRITSIITDPSADPHTYEASPLNQLAISKADLVVENGGGYDDFVAKMVTSSGSKATVLNAVAISGKAAPAGGSLNEHVWYDFPSVQKVADQIAGSLSKTDPADASTYQRNEQAFVGRLQALEATETAIKAAHAGAGVAITEPVPLYLLQACGLDNRTPPAFSAAVEEARDVSPAVLQQMLDLFSGKQVKLLAYNEQASNSETDQILKAAKAQGVAVVPVTETLPAGKDYLTWMQDNLAAVKSALG